MMTLLIIIHVIACIVLIGLVLIQRGRGAGLVESFAGVESMFGTKTSAFLTRTTTIMSVVFFITCLSLAVMSVKQSKSLMRNVRPVTPKTSLAVTEPAKVPSPAPKPETVTSEAIKVQTPPPPPANAPAAPAKPDAAKSQ
ncbi:MAG: preprotein translocase subunit SecG [Candidatus Omnitrophica bacterium]|nr:preprotein translocase subunit SecG [Candidatus Omnitrophota bacterium]